MLNNFQLGRSLNASTHRPSRRF